MSRRRKPPGPGVSPDSERRECVLDPRSPAEPPTGRSWTSLKEQRCGGSEPGIFSWRDQEDGPLSKGRFSSSSLDSCRVDHRWSDLENRGEGAGSVPGDTADTPREDSMVLAPALEKRDSAVLRDEIRAVSVNGTLIVPEPCCLVTPVLRRPPDPGSSPALAVPLLCCRFDPTLDRSTTLITSFSRFPYPTQAELSRLTAASRLPEGQIRSWFSTQRLKQGISWAPEEVEEARKKMFNGSASASDEGPVQSNTADVSSGARAGGAVPAGPRRGAGAPVLGSELKWPVSRGPGESLRTPAPAPAKQKISLSLPLELPKERLPLSPIASANLTRSLIHWQMNNHGSAPSIAPKNKLSCFANDVAMFPAPAVTGAAVDQGLPDPAPLLESVDLLRRCCAQSDGKHWPFEQAKTSQYGSENSCADFPLRERSIPTGFPLLEKVKDQSLAQMERLEESVTRSSVPSGGELQQLAVRSGLSGADLEGWFRERWALWDPCSGPC